MGTKVERRKLEEMNEFGLKYIYTWKCHKETPCIDILNKQKCHFFFYNIREQEDRTSLVWGLVPVGRARCGERV
jgi:hypothetical protein